MCKYALQRRQPLDLERMAARLGLTVEVVRVALLWLQAKAQITLDTWEADNTLQITPGTTTTDPEARAVLQAQLLELLAEVRAYRRYFLRAKVRELGIPLV